MSTFADQAADAICPLPVLEKLAAAITLEEVNKPDELADEEKERKNKRYRNAILATIAGLAGVGGLGALAYYGGKRGWFDPVQEPFAGLSNEPGAFDKAMRTFRKWTWAPTGVAMAGNLAIGTVPGQRTMPARFRKFLRNWGITSATKNVIGMEDMGDYMRRRGTPAAQELEAGTVQSPKVKRTVEQEAALRDLYSILEGSEGPASGKRLGRELKRILQPDAPSQFKKIISDPDVKVVEKSNLERAIKSRETRLARKGTKEATKIRLQKEVSALRDVLANPKTYGMDLIDEAAAKKMLTRAPKERFGLFNPRRWLRAAAARRDVRLIDDTVNAMRRTAKLIDSPTGDPLMDVRRSEAVARVRKQFDEAGLTVPGKKYTTKELAMLTDTLADGMESIKTSQKMGVGSGILRAAAIPTVTQLIPWAAETFIPEKWVTPSEWYAE